MLLIDFHFSWSSYNSKFFIFHFSWSSYNSKFLNFHFSWSSYNSKFFNFHFSWLSYNSKFLNFHFSWLSYNSKFSIFTKKRKCMALFLRTANCSLTETYILTNHLVQSKKWKCFQVGLQSWFKKKSHWFKIKLEAYKSWIKDRNWQKYANKLQWRNWSVSLLIVTSGKLIVFQKKVKLVWKWNTNTLSGALT